MIDFNCQNRSSELSQKRDVELPCFLDVEASGFGAESYPIEVAWSTPRGDVRSFLINPESVGEWTHWDREAESVHGISRAELLLHGSSPEEVVSRFTEDLGKGACVWSDNDLMDSDWLNKLFAAAGASAAEIRVCFFYDLPELSSLSAPARRTLYGANTERHHRAGADVGCLMQIFKSAQQLQGG